MNSVTNQLRPWPELGVCVDRYKQIPIYSNGNHPYESHGKHFSDEGYYYGHKWQCVEFVKRFYYDAHQHKMPNAGASL